MDHNFIWILLILATCLGHCWSLTCTGQTDCKFKTDQGQIDLNTLSPDNKPKFTVKDGDYTYSFNPCRDFTLEAECTGVNSCQSNGDSYYPAGNIASMTCKGGINGSEIAIEYSKTSETQIKRTTLVLLFCGDSDKLEILTEYPQNTYVRTFDHFRSLVHWSVKTDAARPLNMKLTTSLACLGGKGLSVGSILLIVFFVTLGLYFILGALFMWGIKGASGVEIIPNREFWLSLPGLIKDGCSFVIAKIRGTDQTVYGQI